MGDWEGMQGKIAHPFLFLHQWHWDPRPLCHKGLDLPPSWTQRAEGGRRTICVRRLADAGKKVRLREILTHVIVVVTY